MIILIFISISELNDGPYKPNKYTWWIVGFLIILAGFRNPMIDDYAYMNMFNVFGATTPYSIEAMKENIYGVEWLYVLYGKIIYSAGFPFYVFVIFTAIFTISVKYRFISNNSAYPALSLLLYMIPTYFAGDMGHMRQTIAIGLVFISYEFIKRRQLIFFLIIIYIAYGFHNSSIVFLFAYWLVLIPMKNWVIILLVGTCMILSPFEVYNNIGLLESITPSEVMGGYQDYQSLVEEDTGRIRFNDLLSLFYLYFILAFNKEAEEKIPYYEYMRNLLVIGICIYFIFRNSPIFSTRLVAYYLLFACITAPSIIAAISSINLRKYLYAVLLCFVVFYYFVFAALQGKRAFSISTYSNWLIGG